MNRLELKEIILDQNQQKLRENIIERGLFTKILSYIKNPFVIVISGIRRSGKSTLLGQIREKYPGYYLNFDDERLIHFKVEDFQLLYETFLELYGEKKFFYFDEIQNVPSWERFVRRLHDEKKKVFVTGSNASMLSRELGTHLTGRHLEICLFPFSFKEFLIFNKFKIERESVYLNSSRAKIKGYFEEFLLNGGMPEYLREKNPEYLRTLYENIIYRDIIVRFRLPGEKVLKELVYLAINSVAKEISFNSLKKLLNIGSSTTVKEYFDYLENSFLVFLIPKFDYSLKKQIYANKKVYSIDNGITRYLGFRTSNDYGRLLENLVFIELKRLGKEVYYHFDIKECDFVIRRGIKIIQAIQVCYEISNENKQREIDGLIGAMKRYKLKEGIILTLDDEDELNISGKKIFIKPVWKWLLE